MKKKRFVITGAAMFFGLFIIIQNSWGAASLEKLTIGWSAISGSQAPFWITKEAGLFEKNGLDVTMIYIDGGSKATQALLSGDVPIVQVGGSAPIVARLRGADVPMIAGLTNVLAYSLVVASEIKKPEDLKGKKLAISGFGTLTDMLTREILIDNGLKPMQDVMLLQTGGVAVRLAALKSGNVQGTLLASQQALAALQDGYRVLEYNPPPFVSHPLIVKNEMLGGERNTTRAFLRALLKVHLFYGQRHEESLNVIQKVLRIDDRKVARETYEDELRRYNPGGGFEAGNMRKVIERVRETRKMEHKVEIPEVFDLGLAADVEAELKKAGWKP